MENSAQFVISVKSNKRLDFEMVQTAEFNIVAREVGASELSASARVTVNLMDANDNAPKFDQGRNSKFSLKILM